MNTHKFLKIINLTNHRPQLLNWLLVPVLALIPNFSYAEMSFEAAEEKAAEAHKLAASDVIYQEQDWKALYYQNLQMISLLQDIKLELEKLNARESKDDIKKEIS